MEKNYNPIRIRCKGMFVLKLLRVFYIVLFFVAGLAHLIIPELFLKAMPPYIPWHLEVVYLTGILEIVLGLGLVRKRSRQVTARASAIYLLALLPAHIHVSLEGIEMFGISDPRLLWARTAFQFVLIAGLWPLSKQELNPRD